MAVVTWLALAVGIIGLSNLILCNFLSGCITGALCSQRRRKEEDPGVGGGQPLVGEEVGPGDSSERERERDELRGRQQVLGNLSLQKLKQRQTLTNSTCASSRPWCSFSSSTASASPAALAGHETKQHIG